MAVIPGSVSGIVSTADAVMVVGLAEEMERRGLKIAPEMAIKHITFYNPHTSAAPFILQKRVLDENGEERIIERYDKSIPATDSWIFGTLGAVLVLDDIEHWYELLMDSAPVKPIKYCVDFGLTT